MDLERPKESPLSEREQCKRDADTQARIGIGVINDESQIGDESQIWASIMLARP
jgi:hypothetical protein